jgi:RNA 2',3'-cyclic 3'-phosphodiesterase
MSSRQRLQRVFFALWPDEAFCTRLHIAAVPLLERLEGRRSAAVDWHVTVCFIGSVNEAVLATLQTGAGALEPCGFALQFDRLEYWKEARVVAITATAVPPAALELAQALRSLMRSVGLTPDERPLRPHLTLMRGVAPRVWSVVHAGRDQRLNDGLDFNARAFYLACSEPNAHSPERVQYSRLASWPLTPLAV